MIKRCVWISSVDDFQYLPSDDLKFDGGTAKFSVGDMVLLAQPTGIVFYTLKEYSATPVSRAGYIITGGWSEENSAYPIFYKTIFSYSLASLAFTSASADYTRACTYDSIHQQACNMWQNYASVNDMMYDFSPGPGTVIDSPSFSKLTNALTESDYLEAAGADLVWQPGHVEVNKSAGSGAPLAAVAVPQESLPGAYSYCPSLRGNHSYYVEATLYTGSGHIRTYHISDLGVLTQISSLGPLVFPDSSDQQPAVTIGHVARDLVAVGVHNYNGSKTDQGAVMLFDVDSSFKLVNGRTILQPTPTRLGYFGRAVGLCEVDLSGGGTDTHLISGSTDDIVFLSESDGFTTQIQVIAGNRNDYIDEVWCGRNYATTLRYDSDNGIWVIDCYHYDGSSWALTLTFTGVSTYGRGGFVTDTTFLFESTTNYHHYQLTPTNATFIGSISTPTYGTMRGRNPVVKDEMRVVTTLRTGSGPYPNQSWIWELSPSAAPVMLITEEALWESSVNWYNFAVQGTGDVEKIYVMANPDGYRITLFEGIPGVPPLVYAGTHIFYSANDDGRILIGEGVSELITGSAAFSQPSFGKIRFAFSYDDGTTWMVWQSGVGFQTLSSITDLATTTYGDISLVALAIAGLDVLNNKTISIAFCIDRTNVSIDPLINTTITSLTYQVDYPAVIEYTLGRTTSYGDIVGVDVNVSNSVEYDLYQRGFRLAFFDKLT